MEITEKKIIDKIELVKLDCIQVRVANIIEKDGSEIAKTYQRYVLTPIDDISNEDPKIQSIANAVWTPDVIETYKAEMQKIEDKLKAK
jgi:hypothetical protein